MEAVSAFGGLAAGEIVGGSSDNKKPSGDDPEGLIERSMLGRLLMITDNLIYVSDVPKIDPLVVFISLTPQVTLMRMIPSVDLDMDLSIFCDAACIIVCIEDLTQFLD